VVSTELCAAAAGFSNALLSHYYPTNKYYIVAGVVRGQRELAKRLRPDQSLSPEEQLDASLDAFLDYVEEHATAYTTIFTGGVADREIAAELAKGRGEQMEALLAALAGWETAPFSTRRTPALETAVQGWLFFVEGAVLRWLEHRDLDRAQMRTLLRSALGGALMAAATTGA
jgi:hypothetical protein